MDSELSYLLELGDTGVTSYDGDDAIIEQVKEWLDTPQGSVYGRPSYGHDLIRFQHEPPNSTYVAIGIEFSVVEGISRDLPNVKVSSIFCHPSDEDTDKYEISIGLPSGQSFFAPVTI